MLPAEGRVWPGARRVNGFVAPGLPLGRPRERPGEVQSKDAHRGEGKACMHAERDTTGRHHRLCAVGCISLPARDKPVVLHLLCCSPSNSFLFWFKILRLTTLIDCPAGSVADPSHYPASRCVLPVTAQAAEASCILRAHMCSASRFGLGLWLTLLRVLVAVAGRRRHRRQAEPDGVLSGTPQRRQSAVNPLSGSTTFPCFLNQLACKEHGMSTIVPPNLPMQSVAFGHSI